MTDTNTHLLTKALQWRYATKIFDSQWDIPEDTLAAILEAARLTPTSYGFQPFKVHNLHNRKDREALVAASWGQQQITTCSNLLVVSALIKFGEVDINHYFNDLAAFLPDAKDRLTSYKERFTKNMLSSSAEQRSEWAKKQTYLVASMMMAQAALMHIDSCPMEGFDPAIYAKHLGLADSHYLPTILLALGKRSEKDSHAQTPKFRQAKEKLFFDHPKK